MVAKRVEDATAPAAAFSKWQGESKTTKEEDAEQVGRVCCVWAIWYGGEGSAGKRASLGGDHGLAGGVELGEEFGMLLSVDCLARVLLPSTLESGRAILLLHWWWGVIIGKELWECGRGPTALCEVRCVCCLQVRCGLRWVGESGLQVLD